MKYAAVYTAFLRSPPAVVASASALGTWVKIYAYACELEGMGAIPRCRCWPARAWMATAMITPEELEEAVASGLCEWRGSDLQVAGYDTKGQAVVEKLRSNGRKGGRPAETETKTKPDENLAVSQPETKPNPNPNPSSFPSLPIPSDPPPTRPFLLEPGEGDKQADLLSAQQPAQSLAVMVFPATGKIGSWDLVAANPMRALPRSLRRMMRPAHDPRTTPFLERTADIRRVFLALKQPVATAFAIGALAGLRPGEVLGLEWQHVDLARGRIQVRQQVQNGRITGLKDDESRMVPIMRPLAPLLTEYRLLTGGAGLLFRPSVPKRGGHVDHPPLFVRQHTLGRNLRDAFKACGLPPMRWYEATRHTFASQWVLAGGSIEKLSKVLGHSSVLVSERYAHLRTDLFRDSDLEILDIDLSRPGGEVIELAPRREAGAVGCGVGAEGNDGNGIAP